jgi:hypothetical protein
MKKDGGGPLCKGLVSGRMPDIRERRSNTEGAIADEDRDFVRFGGGVGRGVSCYVGHHIVLLQYCGRYREGGEGKCGEGRCSFCGLLIFVQLKVGVTVFAAAVFERHTMTACAILWHTALTANFAVFIYQAPGKEFAHAIVQVDGGPHGGGQIHQRQYGKEKLFHVETWAKV